MLFGAAAGLIVWLIFEPQIPANYNSSEMPVVLAQMTVTLGIVIGMVLGGFEGWLQGSRTHLIRGIVLGGVLGFVGISIGGSVGNGLLSMVHAQQTLDNPSTPMFVRMPLRILALTPIGVFLGAAIGATTFNWKRVVQGAIGGLIGAFIGSALFDPVSSSLAGVVMSLKHVAQGQSEEVGIFGRAFFCLILGAGIGLFIGIVENVAKVAWLRLSVGRNEGREWVVDLPITTIGRSETANVPLFGDASIAPKHATIHRNGPEYLLVDEGSPTGTLLNGQRITQAPLFHGAIIQIGNSRLEFLMKVGSAPQRAAEALRSQNGYAFQAAPVAAPYGAPTAAYFPAAPIPAPSYPTQAVPTQPYQPPTSSVPTQAVPAQPYAQAATDTLVAISGPLTGQRFPVAGTVEIGREANGIGLSFDTSASRRHATVTQSPGGPILSDLGSTNGTFVNDQKVQAATLVKGDVVRIGISSFRVE